jgi:HK97 family phage portal protein
MTTITRPPFWQRINPFRRENRRAIDLYGGERVDLLSEQMSTAESRRLFRNDADMVAIYGAVYAAIRMRTRAVVKPTIHLMRRRGQEEDEVEEHPALDAFRRVNESLTFGQGFGMIEQHKLTEGKAYWVKRRDGLGTPVEFEIWPPDEVKPIPDEKKPWVPARFERRKSIGVKEIVAKEDVIWFRHMVDPRNPLNGLGPIGAVRTELDTGIEAQRFNQRYFDAALHMGRVFSAEDAGPGEVERIEQDLERKFKGTDKAHRAQVLGGGLKPLDSKVPHKDMEFLAQQQWGVEEVARVMEVLPELLGLGSRTYENAPTAWKNFWQMMADQVEATLDEFNEFLIWPDFGEEFRLVAHFDNIPALQGDRKHQAEVDEIYLRTGKTIINEVRDRDGEEAVEWGDVPIMPLNVAPLGTIPAFSTPQQVQADAEEPRMRIVKGEASMERGWYRRLRAEAGLISKHLAAADKRMVQPGDVDSYEWDAWWERYGPEVTREFEFAYSGALAGAGFVETPLVGAKELAERWARERAAEMLSPGGRESIVETTREWVRGLVGRTIEQGESLNTLIKNLMEGFGFSRTRAELIARTEARNALGRGTLESYKSQAHEGKEWLAGGWNPCPICLGNAGEGAIPVDGTFSSGHETVGAHPRCQCNLLPVRELPRG